MTDFPTDRPLRPLADHNCFGCGQLNPSGLHLQFFQLADDSGVWAPWMPTTAFEGYGGMIHGGIICTLLDEIMAWTLYRREIWAVTAKMETQFRHPVLVGEEARLVGRIERDRGRVLQMHGQIFQVSDGALLAEAHATFMRVPESQAAAWNERYQTRKATAV